MKPYLSIKNSEPTSRIDLCPKILVAFAKTIGLLGRRARFWRAFGVHQ